MKSFLGKTIVFSLITLCTFTIYKCDDIKSTQYYINKSSNCIEGDFGKEVVGIRKEVGNILSFTDVFDTLYTISLFDVQTGTYYECVWNNTNDNKICYQFYDGVLDSSLEQDFFIKEYYFLAENADQKMIDDYVYKYEQFFGSSRIYITRTILEDMSILDSNCLSLDEFHVP